MGFGKDQLTEMQKISDAEKNDLFDVLAHVACALEPLTREERANRAIAVISENFNLKHKVFLHFVLSHYLALGVEELDRAKLAPHLTLKYHDSILTHWLISAVQMRLAEYLVGCSGICMLSRHSFDD